MGATLSDFWWLEENHLNRYHYLELGHSKPVDNLTGPAIKGQKYQITTIENFCSKYQNINVYRSLKLSENQSNGEEIMGPFLVDIDNDVNLGATYNIAKQTLEYIKLQCNLSLTDSLRISFSAHKGFNVEIKPIVLNISGQIHEQIKLSDNKQVNMINHLRTLYRVHSNIINAVDDFGTIIDATYGSKYFTELKYPFVRLHNSINSWIGDNDVIISIKKMELSYQDIMSKSIEDIIAASEVKI